MHMQLIVVRRETLANQQQKVASRVDSRNRIAAR